MNLVFCTANLKNFIAFFNIVNRLIPKTMPKVGKFEAKINFPNLKIQLETADAVAGLKEVNKLVNYMRLLETSTYFFDECDDTLLWKLGNVSEEIKNNQELMEFIKSVFSVEENFKHRKMALENKKIFDFNTNAYTSSMDITKIKTKIMSLFEGISPINYCIVHVVGGISPTEKQAIVDLIKNKLSCDVKTLFTNKELLGKTVVEVLMFGSFEQDTFF